MLNYAFNRKCFPMPLQASKSKSHQSKSHCLDLDFLTIVKASCLWSNQGESPILLRRQVTPTLTLVIILILTLPRNPTPQKKIITLTLTICCPRYHGRSNCRRRSDHHQDTYGFKSSPRAHILSLTSWKPLLTRMLKEMSILLKVVWHIFKHSRIFLMKFRLQVVSDITRILWKF